MLTLSTAEMKESVDGLKAALAELPLTEIKERADHLNVPMIISGIYNSNLAFQKTDYKIFLGDTKFIRMCCNLGAGGHLKSPCYLCHLERSSKTNDQFGVKHYENHTDFYDIEKTKLIKLRTVESYSQNQFGDLPSPLKDLIGGDNLQTMICPGSLHILLGKFFFVTLSKLC